MTAMNTQTPKQRRNGIALTAAALLLAVWLVSPFIHLDRSDYAHGKILGYRLFVGLMIMLVFIGIEHAMLMHDVIDSRQDLFITLAIGTIAGATSNIFAATIAGFFLMILFRVASAGRIPGETATTKAPASWSAIKDLR